MMNVGKQWKRKNLARMKGLNRRTRINQNDYIYKKKKKKKKKRKKKRKKKKEKKKGRRNKE